MNAAPTPTRRGIRWGIGDVLWVWFAGLVAGAIAGSIALSVRGRASGLDPDGVDLAVALFAQNGVPVPSSEYDPSDVQRQLAALEQQLAGVSQARKR